MKPPAKKKFRRTPRFDGVKNGGKIDDRQVKGWSSNRSEKGLFNLLGKSRPSVVNSVPVGTVVNDSITPYSPKGRKLRKAFERPAPDQPAGALANRLRKPVTVTLPEDLVGQINSHCEELQVNRTAFIEAAIRQALKPS